MDRDSKASDSQRLVYRDRAHPGFGVPLLALGLFLLSGSLFSIIMRLKNGEPVFGQHGFHAYLFGYVLEFAVLGVGIRVCLERQLVIERKNYRITKTKKLFFWQQSEVYDIRTFDTVSWRS